LAERGTRTEIDMAELEKLCQLQCTDEEIAAWFNVSTRTIERRRLEPEFAEVMTRGKARGRISVRRMQMKLLEEGNATMGVWLGKQLLGQADEVTHNITVQLATIAPNIAQGNELTDGAIDIGLTR
jgi:hypothetical protein